MVKITETFLQCTTNEQIDVRSGQKLLNKQQIKFILRITWVNDVIFKYNVQINNDHSPNTTFYTLTAVAI